MFKFNNSSSLLESALSNLSLDSIEEEEIEPWHGLIHKLTPFHLDGLHAIFKEEKYRQGISVCRPQPEKGLTKEEFVNAIDEVFGNCKYSLQATLLFSQIDNEDNLKITWDQFLDFIIDNAETKFAPSVELSMGEIFSPPHVKRDTIVKIVLIETQKYFCYAILSKYGHIGLYDGNLNFLTSYYTIMTREDITRKDEERRRRNRWITDAIFVEDLQMFIVTTSTRSIIIYDVAGLKHVPLWLVMGVPNVIQCFAYHSSINRDAKTNILFMGDDHGQILSMNFLQSKVGLLRRKHNDKLSLFYWVELYNEKEFVLIKNYGTIHEDNVRAINFFADNNTIASCSRDINASVVIKHPENRRKPYIFKMKGGASCFSISRFLSILVTGSDDGIVRLWNIVATLKPVAILKGHQSGVICVQIMELQEVFLSFSRDGILKLWAIKEQKCIQTINIKFPPFRVLGKVIEWGTDSIYPGPKRYPFSTDGRTDNNNEDSNNCNNNSNGLIYELPSAKWERSHIFITCCNYMAQLNLQFSESLEEHFKMSVLPPPPLQNSVLIPTNWKICDENIELSRTSLEEVLDEEKVAKHIESLQFILNKDLLSDDNLHNNINYQIATLETKKLQMQNAVSKCAPYLALDLQKIEEIRLPPNLPIPNSKRIKTLVEKTQRMLSAASSRSQIFSESSSSGSRTKSSRSSLISFD